MKKPPNDPLEKVFQAALDISFVRFCRKAINTLERRFELFLEHLANRLRQKWLRPKAAASYTGISEGKLEKMRTEGRGPRFHKFCDMVFYSVPDLDAFMQSLPLGPTDTSDDANGARPDALGAA